MNVPAHPRWITARAAFFACIVAAAQPLRAQDRGSLQAQDLRPTEPAPPLSPAPTDERAPTPAAEPAPTTPPPPAEPAAPEPPAADEAITWQGGHLVAFQEERWVPEEGLEFRSKDDMFSMAIRLRAQFLYQIALPHDPETGEREGLLHGFTIRRARLVFAGNMWGKDTQYKVEFAVAPQDLGMENLPGSSFPPVVEGDTFASRSILLDWYIQWKRLSQLNVRLGQYKVQYSRERVISSGNLNMVDRTIMNAEFNLDRDIGLDIRSTDLFGLDKKLRYYLGAYNGQGANAFEIHGFGLMGVGRLEYLPLGSFSDYTEGDLERRDKPGLSLGAAYAYLDDVYGSRGILGPSFADAGTADYHNATADLFFKYRGLNVSYAFFWRKGKRHGGGAVDEETGEAIPIEAPRNGWGTGPQVGYVLPENIHLEFVARYGVIRGATRDTSLTDRNQLGVGVNYYFAQHAYKVQADFMHDWGPGVEAAGARFDDGLDVFRIQLQGGF